MQIENIFITFQCAKMFIVHTFRRYREASSHILLRSSDGLLFHMKFTFVEYQLDIGIDVDVSHFYNFSFLVHVSHLKVEILP